ncbi:acyl-CoA synthetase (NDP forming) [Sediminihabitans luteus]|uniref:Acyl-CoA synthetase (NDP forming) n=1 Tax=Sediminihabitans luteus TaxID=1138585 RepID=A0A2M9CQG2_9CELL|nr:GNAT family N-acetyltransferase [Sediminihabitans luteus]PJJ74078.1 acyl-CoA synthetase (NDP forming) [Sediminihabitans luteus]GII98007.1 acyl-CoA synthetase [Sediminihabitans luteus]
MEDSAAQGRYPVEWEADVVLRDGGTAHVRPIRPEDAEALQRFHVNQSERSTYLRFFAPMERLSERDLRRFTHVDHVDRVALVAVRTLADGTEEIIGVGRFDRVEPTEAEVAFNIADAAQGRGVGSVLLEHLAAAARELGIRRFTADVLPQNGKMIDVFREAGFELTQRIEDGIVLVHVDLDPTVRSRAVMADREHRAESRSMARLLRPDAVVVVGPGEGDTTSSEALAAMRVTASLVAQGTPTHTVGVAEPAPLPAGAARPFRADDVAAVPAPVELAVLSLAPAEAIRAVRALVPLGVRGLVILSSGYAEAGPSGLAARRELLRAAHGAGMRIVGPASYGLFTTDPERPLNASLLDELPPAGDVGFFCQSAPMAVTLLATVRRRGLGVSSFLSGGHRADVSGNDLMQHWQDDARSKVVCLYLESIGNPRKFSRIARRLARAKPVVVVTAGRSGHVVPPGHAVRTTRAPRRTLEEMLRQSGVIHADNTHHLVDIAQLLAHQPLPAGRRVGVLASSAALAALVAEAVSAAGLEVAPCSGSLYEGVTDDVVERAVEPMYADGACDAVVVVHVPTLHPRDERLSHAVARHAARTGRTTVVSTLGLHGLTDELAAPDADGTVRHVPAYSTPEDAVAALGAVVRYADWRAVDQGTLVEPDRVRPARARALVEEVVADRTLDDPPVALDATRTAELLGAYGINVWPSAKVADADAAVAAADALGWPIALKHTADALRHRTDLGAVRLDLHTADELRTAVAQMSEAFTDLVPAIDPGPLPFEVQPMATSGVACVVRSTEDQLFGPVVAFGLAGDAVDLLEDVAYGVPPLTDVDVAAMVRAVRAAPRLFGYEGAPVADVAALEDLVARVSVMADDLPELRSLELYPVVVADRGAAVLTARVTLAPSSRTDALRRALPG